jgi:GNAT superfamily N-acetyltransferase/RimJ/RimL family protein N-acetyltransferase
MQTRTDTLTTRLLDPYDDEMLSDYQAVAWRAEKEDGRPWNTMWTRDEIGPMFREQTGDARREGMCVFDGDGLVGAGFLHFPLLDNTDKALVVPMVDPARRRRGVGSVLLEAMLQHVRDSGRQVALSETSYSFESRESAPALQFARKHGFAVANIEIDRVLRLPVAEDLLDGIAERSRGHHGGYRIETYVDELPVDRLASYCELGNQLVVEAPMGDLDYEAEASTPEVEQQKRARSKAMGRSVYTTVAVQDGTVVAFSDIMVPPSGHEALQWATLVARGHRGHRLGAAVKVANLRALQRDRPDLTEVHTQNAEVNEHMVGINDQLGFEPVAVCPAFKRVL